MGRTALRLRLRCFLDELRRRIHRGLCVVGIHGPYRVRWGPTPAEAFRWCASCGTRWRGTYDGFDAGWRLDPERLEEERSSGPFTDREREVIHHALEAYIAKPWDHRKVPHARSALARLASLSVEEEAEPEGRAQSTQPSGGGDRA
jgi:hypothetical protein